jgi:hypothetical protein
MKIRSSKLEIRKESWEDFNEASWFANLKKDGAARRCGNFEGCERDHYWRKVERGFREGEIVMYWPEKGGKHQGGSRGPRPPKRGMGGRSIVGLGHKCAMMIGD